MFEFTYTEHASRDIVVKCEAETLEQAKALADDMLWNGEFEEEYDFDGTGEYTLYAIRNNGEEIPV